MASGAGLGTCETDLKARLAAWFEAQVVNEGV